MMIFGRILMDLWAIDRHKRTHFVKEWTIIFTVIHIIKSSLTIIAVIIIIMEKTEIDW